jgi:hypothetical protein
MCEYAVGQERKEQWRLLLCLVLYSTRYTLRHFPYSWYDVVLIQCVWNTMQSVPFCCLSSVLSSWNDAKKENHNANVWKPHDCALDSVWNVMTHRQKPDFILRRNRQVNFNRRGCQFSRLAAEVCASAGNAGSNAGYLQFYKNCNRRRWFWCRVQLIQLEFMIMVSMSKEMDVSYSGLRRIIRKIAKSQH